MVGEAVRSAAREDHRWRRLGQVLVIQVNFLSTTGVQRGVTTCVKIIVSASFQWLKLIVSAGIIYCTVCLTIHSDNYILVYHPALMYTYIQSMYTDRLWLIYLCMCS